MKQEILESTIIIPHIILFRLCFTSNLIIYYDNGQKPLKRILNIIFSSRFSDIEVRRVRPVDYKLFQVADLICTLEHIYVKIELGLFSNSEKEFFSRPHDFKRDYWRKIENQQL